MCHKNDVSNKKKNSIILINNKNSAKILLSVK